MQYTLNIRGRLMDLSHPVVMGILNVTPDSFYARSRVQTEEAIVLRARQIVDEGGAIIDVGACSTRPGSTPVSEEEEMARLRLALPIVRSEVPDAVISVDTNRPDVARMAVEELGADIINDVGPLPGGTTSAPVSSPEGRVPVSCPVGRASCAAHPSVPYILTSQQPTLRDTLLFFATEVERLRSLGHKDIILDPGFGFGKTVEQNYELLAQMERLQVMELPILVGISRKSMIYKPLGITPEEALNGTTALHAIALLKGANILRVHDVKEAVQILHLFAQFPLPLPSPQQ
ncbi:MAG: dihydropteroate synthase [Prevotella sp.]|nr:dihydropteroate synthase [Prevotella sp.]